MVVMMVVFEIGVVVTRSAEKTSKLTGREERNNILPFLEIISNLVDVMGLHHRKHHLLVDSQGDIDLGALHHGGPMLVADGVAKLDTDADYILSGQP